MKKGTLSGKKRLYLLGDVAGIVVAVIVFIVPFFYMIINSLKDAREANLMRISLPSVFHWENYLEAFSAKGFQVLLAFKNSTILTVCSVIGLILAGAMAGYVIQRRRDRLVNSVNSVLMIGLMIPAAVLPTIWVLQTLHIYKTMFSMVMIEIALQLPFTVMLYRGFMDSVPRELEEAALIDGCRATQLFTKIVFPLLKPVTSTVIILNACTVFNDFTNPLYFLPGRENATVQLTLYNFIGQYVNSYNLLFADVIIITIPMLIVFILFNKQLVKGMTAGAVKG